MEHQIIDANTIIGVHPTHHLDLSSERLLRDMEAYKIEMGLTLSTVGIFSDHVKGNEETLELAKAEKRLVPVATVNPARYFGTGEDLRALRGSGFPICRLYPDEQGWPVDSAAVIHVVTQLAAQKLPVMINAEGAGDASRISRLMANYPAPVILCGISGANLSEALALSASRNIMVETHELHVPGALESLAERLGAERIVFGSGAPRRSIAASLYYVMYSEMSDEQKQLVLGGNIKRVLEAA